MKEIYKRAEIEVFKFQAEDVITTSGGVPPEEDEVNSRTD